MDEDVRGCVLVGGVGEVVGQAPLHEVVVGGGTVVDGYHELTVLRSLLCRGDRLDLVGHGGGVGDDLVLVDRYRGYGLIAEGRVGPVVLHDPLVPCQGTRSLGILAQSYDVVPVLPVCVGEGSVPGGRHGGVPGGHGLHGYVPTALDQYGLHLESQVVEHALLESHHERVVSEIEVGYAHLYLLVASAVLIVVVIDDTAGGCNGHHGDNDYCHQFACIHSITLGQRSWLLVLAAMVSEISFLSSTNLGECRSLSEPGSKVHSLTIFPGESENRTILVAILSASSMM